MSSAGAARGIIQYRASETWSLANVVTLAGLERAIPIPLAAEDKLWKQSGEEPASANLTFHTDKVGSAPQYVPKIVEIDEAPPRQAFYAKHNARLPSILLIKLRK